MTLLTMDFSGLRKVISGGQDGVDRGALEAACLFPIEIGGTAPKGYRTVRGSDETLKTRFGLTEHSSPNYPPRTECNVVNSDGTLIIASNVHSRGTALTIKLLKKHNKPYYVLEIPKDLQSWNFKVDALKIKDWIVNSAVEVLNVAGNHERPEFHMVVTRDIVQSVLEFLDQDSLLKTNLG